MANQTITQLNAAGAITGSELVPIVQNGQTVRTTTGAIAASPSLTQTFLTVNNEPTLNNSRYLTSTGSGIGITDNGAQSTLALSLSTPLQTLDTSGAGLLAKTGSNTVTNRSIAVGGGLAVSNASGAAGNPTINLDGVVLALQNSSGTFLLGRTAGGGIATLQLLGTAGEIDVADGTGPSNPTIGLADNPILPGTEGVVVPSGTTGQRAGSPTNGVIRYNTTSQTFEGYANSIWRDFSLTGGVTSFSAGTTGLTPGTTTTGAITLGGILIGANGGTGVANTGKTITLGGSLTLSGAHDLTLTQTGATNVTLPTTGTLATLAGSETLTNKTINGSNNTLSNIANASLTNSSITINGSSVSLGGSVTVTATASNALTIGTGLSGTSYNGSTPVTIAISNTGVSAATYGSASIVPVIAVNAQGQITSATDTAIAIAASQVTSGTLPTTRGGTGQSTYTAGDMLFYDSSTLLNKLAIGASTYLITSTGSAPQWTAPSSVAVGTATNIAGGAAGSVPYQTGAGATSLLALGTQGYVLRAGAAAPEWAAVDGGIFT